MPYHDEDTYQSLLDAMIARAGERAATEEIAQTHRGRPVDVVKIAAPGRKPSVSRPQVLITANIHGLEVIGSEIALALCARLTSDAPYGAAAALLDSADVCIVPISNPDGRARALDSTGGPLPASLARRTNDAGVDLNRNFPFPEGSRDAWHPLSGTRIRFLPWYRGSEPLSEPETTGLQELAGALRPKASLALHSAGRLFLYPYCYTREQPADIETFREMGAAFRAAQPIWKYRVKQSATWYAILGDLDDFLYAEFGTLACTVEISRPGEAVLAKPMHSRHGFWWANPKASEPYINNDTEACLAAMVTAIDRSA